MIALLAPSYATTAEVVEQLLRMPRIDATALEHMAQVADERCGEIIATNEQLMLKYPTVIEKLYMNKRVRMSTADRLIELAVRNHIELGIPAFRQAAAAIMNELLAGADAGADARRHAVPENAGAGARYATSRREEDTHETDEEGEERVRNEFLPLYAQVAKMTVSQKIRAAMLGNAATRLLLIRDPNRLVAAAAVRSPNMREDEAVRITLSRAVSEDVLREIAMNREFTRSYQVKLNLIGNPRTPLTFAARLIPHLRDNDLRALAKSKNISSAICAGRPPADRAQEGRIAARVTAHFKAGATAATTSPLSTPLRAEQPIRHRLERPRRALARRSPPCNGGDRGARASSKRCSRRDRAGSR